MSMCVFDQMTNAKSFYICGVIVGPNPSEISIHIDVKNGWGPKTILTFLYKSVLFGLILSPIIITIIIGIEWIVNCSTLSLV